MAGDFSSDFSADFDVGVATLVAYATVWDQVTADELVLYDGFSYRDLGQTTQLHVLFRDQANDEPVDPSGVTLVLRDPTGAMTTYVYHSDALIERIDVGHYLALFAWPMDGAWRQRWTSTDTFPAARERTIKVRRALAVSN